MIAWVRLVLCALALAGLIAAAPGASLAKAYKATGHHHCMNMPDGDGPDDAIGSLPACCVAAACAMVQPVFAEQASVLIPTRAAQIELPLLDDLWRSGVRPPLDLRPPIA